MLAICKQGIDYKWPAPLYNKEYQTMTFVNNKQYKTYNDKNIISIIDDNGHIFVGRLNSWEGFFKFVENN